MWELIFMLLILKIPVAYLAWVVWWAVKAEPDVGGSDSVHVEWRPWTRRSGPRPRRGGPHGSPVREAGRAVRRSRAGT
jgi:hypothetical protein